MPRIVNNNSAIGAALHLDRGRVQVWRTRWRAAALDLGAAEAADPDDFHLGRAISIVKTRLCISCTTVRHPILIRF
jgi:hypothetical protein